MIPIQYKLLSAWTLCGLNPRKLGLVRNILCTISLFNIAAISFLNMLELFINWNGIDSIANVYFLPLSVIILVKSSNMVVNAKVFVRILDMIDAFWTVDFFGENVEKDVTKVHTLITMFVHQYTWSSLGCCAILVIVPLADRTLIFSGYEICDVLHSPCYELLYAWQFLTMLIMIPAVMSFDMSFLCLVGRIYSAIEMVKHALILFVRVPTDYDNRCIIDGNIMKIIQQHDLVLRCVKEMNKFYSGILLVQFWASLGTLIFCLYILTANGFPPDTKVLSQFGILLVLLVVQIFFYSLGGNIIIEQTISVASAAYSTDWYSKTESKLREKIQFIIMRSQKFEKITVGNMANLDLEAFVAVIKNTLSVYTLLRTVDVTSQMEN